MPYPTKQQVQNLGELWRIANDTHHGNDCVVGRFLLGLYNGTRFPFDLTDLRTLDPGVFERCLDALRMDYAPYQEVHETIGRHFYGGSPIGMEFELLAWDLRMKNAASRASLKGMKPRPMGEFTWHEGVTFK